MANTKPERNFKIIQLENILYIFKGGARSALKRKPMVNVILGDASFVFQLHGSVHFNIREKESLNLNLAVIQ